MSRLLVVSTTPVHRVPTVEKTKIKNSRNLCKEVIRWQGWTERKGLVELLANEKAVGPLLGVLKSTEVGGEKR